MLNLSSVPLHPVPSRARRLLHLSSFLAVVAVMACGTPGDVVDPDSLPPNDPPCSCETGARRCIGKSVQVCEQESEGCSSWGSLVACPSGTCQAGSCQGSCQDTCPAGLSRCSQDGGRDVCRVGGSGCLEWVKQDCPSGQFCDAGESQCKPVISCDSTCPKGYTCRPTGVCGGGTPQDLVLDVRPDSITEVNVSGRITLNGSAPRNGSACSATVNPRYTKAVVLFTNKKTGANVDAMLLCKDAHFDWATKLVPGVYSVRVQGIDGPSISDLPTESYVADSSFIVTTEQNGKVLDLKTLSASGRITFNGAAPKNTSLCSATMNPGYVKADVQFYEKTHGYTFGASLFCKDAGYAWNTTLYPGTYIVRVRGQHEDFTNLPTQSYVADGSLTVTTSTSDKVLDLKTLAASGRITLNGAAPKNTSLCSATMNPDYGKAYVQFYEKTYGYTFESVLHCRDAGYAWNTTLYPGAYTVRVRGQSEDLSNLPTQSYVTDGSLIVTTGFADKVLDLKLIPVAGRVTLLGAPPKDGALCSKTENPGFPKAHVVLQEASLGYRFDVAMLCADAGYAFSTAVYPGTYSASVVGSDPDFTNLPGSTSLVVPRLQIP